jgi:hypothetical protein
MSRAPVGGDATHAVRLGGEIQTVTIQAPPEEIPIVLDHDVPRTLGLKLASRREEGRAPIVTVRPMRESPVIIKDYAQIGCQLPIGSSRGVSSR